MERHLGTRLFQRGKSGARLTEDGTLLHRAVEAGFLEIEHGLSRLEARQSGKVIVTLSVSTAFTTHWLMPRIARCQARFPQLDLRFQLIAGTVVGPMGNVDIAMRYAQPSDVTGRFVMHEAYIPVCTPAYLEEGNRQARNTFIQLEGNRPSHFVGVEGWTGRSIDPQLAFSDYAVVVQAALMGQGVAAGWLNVVSHWLRHDSLIPAATDLVRPGRVCHIVTRRDSDHAAIIADFADWIIEELYEDLAAVQAKYPQIDVIGLTRPG